MHSSHQLLHGGIADAHARSFFSATSVDSCHVRSCDEGVGGWRGSESSPAVLAPVDWGSACFLALVVSPLLRELNVPVLIGNSFFGRVRRSIAASQQLFPAGR